jgi:dTDP-4-dehydrorhamnose 3,5-epimerase
MKMIEKKFKFEELELPGLFRIHNIPNVDAREMVSIGWTGNIAQINKSITHKKGSVRGLHYQNYPYTEKKIITCESGEIWDVAVDIRRGSKTFLKYHIEILSEASNTAIYIPEGFAHGFQALKDNSSLLYFHSEYFSPEFQGGINVLDSLLSIPWPLPILNLSDRDSNFTKLSKNFQGVDFD